jgi:hypothetical protein
MIPAGRISQRLDLEGTSTSGDSFTLYTPGRTLNGIKYKPVKKVKYYFGLLQD